jgi:hypothetical protein
VPASTGHQEKTDQFEFNYKPREVKESLDRFVIKQDELIGIWFFARPLVLDATRVKENCFSRSLIAAPSLVLTGEPL